MAELPPSSVFGEVSNHISKWGVVWGFVYAMVALGFYFTAPMILLLGLASASTALALQGIIFQGFKWHFALLGLLCVFETALLYLRRQGVRKLNMADITLHRAYLGTLVVTFFITYAVLFFLVSFLVRSS